MSSRNKKPIKGRHPAAAPEKDQFRARREASFQLHDEADLVNFRADALNRYISNQSLLDNVALKLVHTARLVPPNSFPKRSGESTPLYEKDASNEQLLAVVADLQGPDLYFGDLRLMKAKQKLLARELAAMDAEDDPAVLSAESQFQKAAVERLAALQARCTDAESLDELERALEGTLAAARTQFGQDNVFLEKAVRRYSVPVLEMGPGVDVKEAPAGYHPRMATAPAEPATGRRIAGVASEIHAAVRGDPRAASIANPTAAPAVTSYMPVEGEYSEFGILPGGVARREENEVCFDPQLDGAREDASTDNARNLAPVQEESAVSGELAAMGGGVEMDDIDQYLADPDANDDMDEMNALIDFDAPSAAGEDMPFTQGNEQGAPDMDDDPFSVDFLSLMGNGME